MTSNQTIIISLLSFIAIFVVAYIWFHNMSFTSSDAAGNGMAKGLTLLYGLVFFFVVAIVLSIFLAFQFDENTSIWLKILSFTPALIPLSILGVEILK